MRINEYSKAPQDEALDVMKRQTARLKFQSVNWASEAFEDTRQRKNGKKKSLKLLRYLKWIFNAR